MICTFLGHRDAPECIRDELKRIISDLIEKEKVNRFYVGEQGKFDFMAVGVLKELKLIYPQIDYRIALAYMPAKRENYENTIYPEGMETVAKKFAIDYRNKWMINRSDIVIAYVTRNFGGAAKHINFAEKKGKRIIKINPYR